jgi:hypothetical protein
VDVFCGFGAVVAVEVDKVGILKLEVIEARGCLGDSGEHGNVGE